MKRFFNFVLIAAFVLGAYMLTERTADTVTSMSLAVDDLGVRA